MANCFLVMQIHIRRGIVTKEVKKATEKCVKEKTNLFEKIGDK